MRRTALLVSAGLLAALIPFASAHAADDPVPAPVSIDRFEGEVPFAGQPADVLYGTRPFTGQLR